MFSKMGEYEAAGIFSVGHFILIAITIIGILIALKYTTKKNKKEIHNIIKFITITMWILEIIKIVFNIHQNTAYAVNTYLPLYYCSILLYAGILSSFGKGTLKRIGDVSLATGAIVGGIVFIIYPSTSLPIYPAYHFLSIHSFLFHGAMVYLGILINKTKYIELKIKDAKYFAALIGTMCMAALIVNKSFNGNLMFISNNFPGTPLEILYKITNGGILYNLIMIIAQMTIPFYIPYYLINKINSLDRKKLIEGKLKSTIIVAIVLIIQTVVFIIAGLNKSYIHMDEAYSLGLANYNKIDIQNNADFYNNWHNKYYYEDYLTVNESEKNDFSPVYENQKNDVHPPLYYFLLRIAMQFHIDSYSIWPGIILNIIIYFFVTIFIYLILKKILCGKNNYIEKSAIIALLSSITLAAINNVIYVRMYALATLNILITTYLHLKLLDKKTNKLLIAIGISALTGSLTHYYYLFYLAILFIMFVIKYIKNKQYKELLEYIATIFLSAVISLLIFPYSIQHIFFGYRGQGAISNFSNISKFLINICLYLLVINVYAFNNILIILLFIMLALVIYKKIKRKSSVKTKNKYIKYIIWPTLGYFVLASISSPWIELRYMMPICGLIFILTAYLFLRVLEISITKEKVIIAATILLMLTMPTISNKVIELAVGKEFRNEQESDYFSKQEIGEKLKQESNIPINLYSLFSNETMENILLFVKNFKIEPEVMFSNKHEIVQTIKNNSNLPAVYFFNSNNNRFLDDILLFANIDESYIAKDIEIKKEKIEKIISNKNTSNGILIFINDGQDSEKIINITKDTLKKDNITYLKRLNACDVYLLK